MSLKQRTAEHQVPNLRGTRNLQVSYRPICQLICNTLNPRIHTDKQIGQISRSIAVFGFIVPILVDSEGNILAGHGRYLAAKLLGLTLVPVIVVDHLTQWQMKAFIVADNKLTENASWNEQLLAQELKLLSEADLDFSVDVTGFEVGEIDCLIEGLSPATQGGDDPADLIPSQNAAVQISQSGDLWILHRHRVYCGNSLLPSSFSALMENSIASMVFTDPPYNVPIAGHAGGLGKVQHRNFQMGSGEMSQIEFTDFLSQACKLAAGYSSDGSIHFVCIDWRHIEELLIAGKNAFTELKNICVWVKSAGGMGSLYRSQHELIFIFKKGRQPHRNNVQLGQYGRYRTNVWQYAGMNSFARSSDEGNLLDLHPTVKPVALVADAIMDCSARDDIVLDPFLGSGTTVIAAERTGRICCGLEIDPAYVDTVVRRWQKFTGLCATHGGSGRTFRELEEEAGHAQQ
jgi:DNA modification methylase